LQYSERFALIREQSVALQTTSSEPVLARARQCFGLAISISI